jgi:hypothetical protein
MPATLIITFDNDPNFGECQVLYQEGMGGAALIEHDYDEATIQSEFDFGIGATSVSLDGNVLTITMIDAGLIASPIEDWTIQNGQLPGHELRLLTTFTISNQVTGSAGVNHSFRLNKPAAGTDTGQFQLKRSAANMSGVLDWNASAAAIEASMASVGQSYTVTDEGAYFQCTRTTDGTNGTFTTPNNAVTSGNPIGDLTVISLSEPATAPAAIDDLAATPGANKLIFTYSQPDDGGATITTQTLKLAVNCVQRVTLPEWLGEGGMVSMDFGQITGESDEIIWDGNDPNDLLASFASALANAATFGDIHTITASIASAIEPVAIDLTFIDDLAFQEQLISTVVTSTGPVEPVVTTITAGGPTVYATGVSSPHEVTGLTGGVASGPWTVTSTNAVGESDPSNAVTETPTAAASGGRRRNRRRMTAS